MKDATSGRKTSPTEGTLRKSNKRQLNQRHTINQCLIPLLNQYAETKSHFTVVECRDALLTHSSLKSIDKHSLYRTITKRLAQCIDKGLAIEVGIRGKKRKMFQMLSALSIPAAVEISPDHSTSPITEKGLAHDASIDTSQDLTLSFTQEDRRELENMIAQTRITKREIDYTIEYLDYYFHQLPRWRDAILQAREIVEDKASKAWGHHQALTYIREVTMTGGEA